MSYSLAGQTEAENDSLGPFEKGPCEKKIGPEPAASHPHPPRSNRWSAPLSPAGSSSDRLDSIRHLFYFFLFLFFNLAARERSGLLIDVALSKLETCGLGGEGPKPLSWVP